MVAAAEGLLTRASEIPSPALQAERREAERLRLADLVEASGVEAKYAPGGDGFVDLSAGALPKWLPAKYRAMARLFVNLLAEPRLVAVGGERGTGKTALGCGLVVACCRRGRAGVYRTAKAMADEVQSAPFEQKPAVRGRFTRADVLVLDETGARDTWNFAELFGVIDARYAAGRATVLMSNLGEEAMARDLGDSVWRRVVESGGFYPADWERIEGIKREVA